jgi:hypothetical protein
MIKHESSAAHIGHEDNKGEVTKNIFCGTAKTRADLAVTIASDSLPLGYG